MSAVVQRLSDSIADQTEPRARLVTYFELITCQTAIVNRKEKESAFTWEPTEMPTAKIIIVLLSILAVSAGIMLAGSQSGLIVYQLPLYVICAACGYILHWLMFLPGYVFQTERYFDLTGSASFIGTVLIALLLHPDPSFLQLLVSLLICVWALRLGWFLFGRIRKSGKDQRFDEIKKHFWRYLLTWTLGGAWVFITLAAALVVLTSADQRNIDGFAVFGLALWVIGFTVEIIADAQKSRFRSADSNAGKFISSGLWAWSRHPNYFGEIVLWIGIAVIALPSLTGWQWLTLVSPLFVIVLLTRISGIPILEKSGRERWGEEAEYQHYVATTSLLIPLPPKKTA